MRTVRVLVSAASVAAVVALAACGESPTAAGSRVAPTVRASALTAPAPGDSIAGFDVSGSLEEQPADTSGTRRGVQIVGGGN